MKSRAILWSILTVGLIVILPATAAIVAPMMRALTSNMSPARLASVARQYPKFTADRRLAILREAQSELHPLWKDLSWSARVARAAWFAQRLVQSQLATSTSTSTSSSANFLGNLSSITSPADDAIGLQRQSDCSLSLYHGIYTLSLSPTIQVKGTTSNYQNVLHSSAALTTRAGVFAQGCVEPTLGIGSRRGAYLGKTSQNLYLFAGSGYDQAAGSNALYYGTVDPNTLQVHSFKTDLSMSDIKAVAAGDLNGDGLADIVGIDATSASIAVWLAHADGTLTTPTFYALPGDTTEAAVLADINGDGKVDVVVATHSSTSGQDQICVLTGNGAGTLNVAQSYPVAAGQAAQISNLIVADLRGNGRADIVASSGLVLLNNGDGTFTTGSSAFIPVAATSSFGPNLVAADFNKDGKTDLAVDDGLTIHIYLGNGNGTFIGGKSYASINTVGYLTASDLDGDGNIDLYVGLANGGFFGGDQFDVNQAYALMGNGDGSFQGAPVLPFVYTGNNLADLNGDKIVDAVGVNADGTVTSYLGDGKGGFSAKGTLATSPVTIGGTPFTVGNVESFAIGDINGDGMQDLAYIATAINGPSFNGPGGTPGVFIASGNGQGTFASPIFYPVPSTLSAGDIDISWTLSNLHLADLNHDGKEDLIYNYSDTSSHSNTINFGTAVQLGNGDGTFKAPQIIPYRSTPYSDATNPTYDSQVELIADLNQDGNPDLVFITQSSTIDSTLSTYVASIQLALGKGDGTFTTPSTVTGPDLMTQGYSDLSPPSIVATDMNGDGIPDLIALGSSSTHDVQVSIALGKGDGTFKMPALKSFSAQYLTNAQGLAVGDFDGDGKLDVAIVDPFPQLDNGISLGNGDGTLQSSGGTSTTLPNLPINLLVAAPVAALDVNGDGRPDLIAGNVELLSQVPTSGLAADFSLTASSTSATVTAGKSVQDTLTITPSNGFAQSVALTCSGLPAGASCAFSPAAVAVDGSAVTSTLTITTTARTAMNSIAPGIPSPPGVLLAGLGLPLAWRRRRPVIAIILISVAALHGCGGGGSSSSSNSGGGVSSGTPAGSYTITVEGNAGSANHSVPYTLTVN